MSESVLDPRARLHYADSIMQEAAQRLEALLREAARQLEPFPPFPGAFFSYGVEVEPAGVANPNLGCVVVTPEGELKELVIGIDDQGLTGATAGDPVAMREEHFEDLDLSPRERFLFAYEGLRVVTALLAAGADGREGTGAEGTPG